jgi:hypothetical protein
MFIAHGLSNHARLKLYAALARLVSGAHARRGQKTVPQKPTGWRARCHRRSVDATLLGRGLITRGQTIVARGQSQSSEPFVAMYLHRSCSDGERRPGSRLVNRQLGDITSAHCRPLDALRLRSIRLPDLLVLGRARTLHSVVGISEAERRSDPDRTRSRRTHRRARRC